MKRTSNQYSSNNSIFGDEFNIEFSIGKKMEKKSKLDEWLTERYALFQDTKTSINEFHIHHLEWEIDTITKRIILGDVDIDEITGAKITVDNVCEMINKGFDKNQENK